MPMKRDPEGGGTLADGTRTQEYCSYCFAEGGFRQPDITAEEMRVFVKGKLKEMGFPGFLTGFFTRNIPKLGRWTKQVS